MRYPGFDTRGHVRKQALASDAGEEGERRSTIQESEHSVCETAEVFCSP